MKTKNEVIRNMSKNEEIAIDRYVSKNLQKYGFLRYFIFFKERLCKQDNLTKLVSKTHLNI